MHRFESVQAFIRERKKLPHWQGPGESYFVRFSLRDPRIADLTDDGIAPHVIASLRHQDQETHLLFDYTIMPNHVHCILKPLPSDTGTHNLLGVLCSIKRFSALQINRVLHRTGRLWQEENYDHVLRNLQDYQEKSLYIYMNPVKAGLVKIPSDWPWWGVGSGVR